MTRAFPWDHVRFDAQGLVPVIAQEETSGEVLMMAWANRDALERSLQSGRMTYYSRRRGELWEKGLTSGSTQRLVRLSLDCDGDTVLALVRSDGPACHEGTDTCFARAGEAVPRPVLADLDALIQARRKEAPKGSYTAKLLADPGLAAEKIDEEAAELVQALKGESERRVSEEGADLIYHALVACAGRSVDLRGVLRILAERRT